MQSELHSAATTVVDDFPARMEFRVMTSRVIVCDDEPEAAEGWLNEIRQVLPAGAYDVRPVPTNDQIKESVQILLRRRTALREGLARAADRCLFDEADVLVIDYDLLHVDDSNTRYTGEGVARLARVFSECGVIVVLNQFLEAQFDLGLRGHIESFADLNIDGDLIGSRGLWRTGPWQDFRPWHWPILAKGSDQFKARVEFLSHGSLKRPILEALKMTEGDAARLSDDAFGFIAPGAAGYAALAETTFEDFIRRNSAAVDTRDGDALVEHDPGGCARIAASRIAKWLEREVLGPQDVLVDVPHLLQRCPFLLVGEISDLNVWNDALVRAHDSISQVVPAEAWFDGDGWLGQPALWWRRVENAQAVRESRGKFDFGATPAFVFLEDASRFGRLEDATEFRAGFHNSYDRRYVSRIKEIRYAPQRRFAFGG